MNSEEATNTSVLGLLEAADEEISRASKVLENATKAVSPPASYTMMT